MTATNPPLLEYRFYLNDSDKAFNNLTNVNQYTIHDVQRSRDYGEYKCVASNGAGNGSDTVFLNICCSQTGFVKAAYLTTSNYNYNDGFNIKFNHTTELLIFLPF